MGVVNPNGEPRLDRMEPIMRFIAEHRAEATQHKRLESRDDRLRKPMNKGANGHS
jgi:hypothetical protein